MIRPRYIALLLALITLLAYLPVRHHGFVVIDDPDYLTGNRQVQAGLNWAGVKWAFTNLDAGFWHPLTWLSHMLDCQWFGLNPEGHHLMNLLWHAANVVLLFEVLRRMTGALWRSAMVAALFALHPLHVESVAWAAERKDVLSAFFWMLTMLLYLRHVEAGHCPGARTKIHYAAAWLCFVCGLMSKTMVVTLPLVLLLLDWWPLRRALSWRRLILEKLPFLAAGAVSLALTWHAEKNIGALSSTASFPIDGRIANAIQSYVWYLDKTFWPDNLAVFYPYPKSFSTAALVGSGAVLLLVSVLVVIAARGRPYLVVGWGWYLIMLLPVIGLVQIGGHARADRYTYLPLIGLFMALVWGAGELLARRQTSQWVAVVLAGCALTACAAQTRWQLNFWRDDESLFTRALAVTKDNTLAHVNYGIALEQQARQADALEQYQAALRLDPHHVQAHNNLANLLDEAGNSDEALKHYHEALRLKPAAALAHLNLATLLVKLRKYDEAALHYTEAARLLPDDPRPHYLMGKALFHQNRGAEAIIHFRDALRRDERDFQSLTFLARVLAADESPLVRNGAEAVILAEQADWLTGGGQPFVLDTLAMAFAEAGHFNEAQRTVRKAIELSTAAGAKDNVSDMEQRLKLYQSGLPYRKALTNTPPKSSP